VREPWTHVARTIMAVLWGSLLQVSTGGCQKDCFNQRDSESPSPRRVQ